MNKSVSLKLRVIDWFNKPPEIFLEELNYKFLTESQVLRTIMNVLLQF